MEGYAKVTLTSEMIGKIKQTADKIERDDDYLESIDVYKSGFRLWGIVDKKTVEQASYFISISPFFVEYDFLYIPLSWGFSIYATSVLELEKLSTGFSKEIYLDAQLYRALNRVMEEAK